MKVSIVIPTYEMKGKGSLFLEQSLKSINNQLYNNFEVVVSDDSSDNLVKDICEKFSQVMDLKYNRTISNYKGLSFNTNRAVRFATGDIIKILYQDDFFYRKDSLSRIASEHINGAAWCVTANVSYNGNSFFNYHVPSFHKMGYLGENLIGSPSCLSFTKNVYELFDEKLSWLMDCEFYHRLFLRYGNPKIVSEPCFVNRLWSGQTTNNISEGTKAFETSYVWKKFND